MVGTEGRRGETYSQFLAVRTHHSTYIALDRSFLRRGVCFHLLRVPLLFISHLSPPYLSLFSHINVVGGTYVVAVQSKPAHCIRTYVYTYMNGIHCLRSVGTEGREILCIELPTSTRIYSHRRHVCTHISPSGMSRSVGRIDIC